MKCLIVLASPEPASFNAALAQAAQATLESCGHAVVVSDLYAQGFAADEHSRHYVHRQDPMRFAAQAEQRCSAQLGLLAREVQKEIDALLWADLVVLQFPLWWFAMPAILKGWMDRVFVYGKMYSSSQHLHAGVCKGKRALLSVTAGSSAEACMHDGQDGDTRLILWPVHYSLHYLGFTVLEPTVVTGVRGGFTGADAKAQEHYLESQLLEHRARLSRLDARPTVQFNAAEDWDEHRKLRADAPVHSPFIGHQPWRCSGRQG